MARNPKDMTLRELAVALVEHAKDKDPSYWMELWAESDRRVRKPVNR